MIGIQFGPRQVDDDDNVYYDLMYSSSIIGRYCPQERGAYVYVNKAALTGDIEEAARRRFGAADIDIEFM